MILASSGLSDEHHEVLVGAFELVERTVEEVMTPRTDVRHVEADATVGAAMAIMIDSGFSRLPVTQVGRGMDAAEGVASLQNLVAAPPDALVSEYTKDAKVFPESVLVLVALRSLQEARQQMGFVVDEYGGIEGIVTVEDLVEELVGEIYDEYDRDVATVRTDSDGSYLIPGRFPVHDLVDVGVDVPSGDYTTVAGLVLEKMGRLPGVGESILVDRWRITVLNVEGNAIIQVRFSAESHSGDQQEGSTAGGG
jgi:putative hemolysin